MSKKKVCVFIGSRANYSSIKSVMRQIKNDNSFDLLTVVAASAVLDRFGSVASIVEKDGYEITARSHVIIEGENPTTMAKSTGLCIIEMASVFETLKPDYVLVVGDRFEVMGAAIAASYMNIPLVHTMGGEISGSIDEPIRHAITKLAHVHFPATNESRRRIIAMGEDSNHVHLVGCPRIDEVKLIIEKDNNVESLSRIVFQKGVGIPFDLQEPFILMLQHPVTTEYGKGKTQIEAILDVIDTLGMNTIIMWPNADAGSDDISRGIRIFREQKRLKNVFFIKNLPMEAFICLMNRCTCMVGNSSAAIREGAFIGVSAVNVGTRQQGRERGKNVIDVGYSKEEIYVGIVRAVERKGKKSQDLLYGDGHAGERIVKILKEEKVTIQKRFIDNR